MKRADRRVERSTYSVIDNDQGSGRRLPGRSTRVSRRSRAQQAPIPLSRKQIVAVDVFRPRLRSFVRRRGFWYYPELLH
jgi:hypothetical protein